MRIEDVGRAKILAECSAELALFETAAAREEVVYLKMFRSDGDKVDVEYHLGGLAVIPEIIAETRRCLNEKMIAIGLEVDGQSRPTKGGGP